MGDGASEKDVLGGTGVWGGGVPKKEGIAGWVGGIGTGIDVEVGMDPDEDEDGPKTDVGAKGDA